MTGLHLGVVVNPTAGQGRGAAEGARLVEAVRRRGHRVRDLSAPRAADAALNARAAVGTGLDALLVVGGDGMVHLGVNAVAGTGLPLGIVATGTGNDVAAALGLPRHDVAASLLRVEAAVERGGRAVDAVSVQRGTPTVQHWYLGVLSCGIDAAVSARAATLRWPHGTALYVRALLAELRAFRPYGYRITVDGVTTECTASVVAVANSPRFGGGMQVAPGARMDDGLLDVLVVGPLGRGELLRVFPRVYRGRHLSHPACTLVRGRTVTVEPGVGGPQPPEAQADGEALAPLPVRAEVRPGAVRVVG